MVSRREGQVLCEHEARLVEAGLDEDEAAALLDELECELDALEDEEPEGEMDEESEDQEGEPEEERK